MSNAPRKRRAARGATADYDAAFVYGRISEAADFATARQVKACKETCKARAWPVAHVYCDEGVSAYNGAPREAFDAMLADAAQAAADGRRVVIVAWDLDRLVRRVAEVGRLIDLYDDHGVPFVTVQGGVDLTSAAGKLIAYVLTAVAEMESEHKAERLRLRFAQDREAGRPHWAHRPFGFERDGTHHAFEAPILADLYDRFANGGESLHALTTWLQAEGITQPERTLKGERTAKAWTRDMLARLLRAERNAGLYASSVTGEAPTLGNWAPIVDVDTLTRTVRLLDAKAHGKGNATRHLMSGLLVCDHCGGRMFAAPRSGGKGFAYRCRKDAANGHHGCGRAVAAHQVDALTRDAVLEWLAVPGNAEHLSTTAGDSTDVAALREEIVNVKARHKELVALTADPSLGVSHADVAGHLRDLAAQEQAARARLEGMTTAPRVKVIPTGSPAMMLEGWGRLTLEEQRALILDVLEPVRIRATARAGRTFDPSRVVRIPRAMPSERAA